MKSIEVPRRRIAVLASGSGSTAEAMFLAFQERRINTDIGVIICNRPEDNAGIYDRFKRLNTDYRTSVPVIEIGPKNYPGGKADRGQTDEESQAICDLVRSEGLSHVALMGYMRIVRGPLLEEFGWQEGMHVLDSRMTNTHPGPLPETEDTYGLDTSQRVIDLGLIASSHTFHAVAAGVDTGPVIAAHPVALESGDSAASLFDKVQVTEKAALPYALDRFLNLQDAHRHQE